MSAHRSSVTLNLVMNIRQKTKAYRIRGCNIKLSNRTEVRVEAFVDNKDKSLLKKGNFKLKNWQMGQLVEKL